MNLKVLFVVVFSAIVFCGLTHYYAYGLGYEKAVLEAESNYAKHLEQVVLANKLQHQSHQTLSEQHAQEKFVLHENLDRIINEPAVIERVFVRAASPPSRVCAGPGRKTGSDEKESKAELHPEIVKRLARYAQDIKRIGLECDALAIDFNYLQAREERLISERE